MKLLFQFIFFFKWAKKYRYFLIQISIIKKMKLRLTRFDLLKLLAMFLICMTHCFQRFYSNYSFTNSIFFAIPYSVSLGLFFFTGGFFIKRTSSLKELGFYILKTIITYLAPAYLFTCLSIWTLSQYGGHDFGWWMMALYKYTDYFYWYFLTACFINIPIAIFYYLFHLIYKKDGFKLDVLRWLLVLFSLAGYMWIFIAIYNKSFEGIGPKCLSSDMFLFYLPTVFIGFTFAIFSPYIKKSKATTFMTLFISVLCLFIWISIVIIFQNNWFQGLSGSFLDIFWRWLASITGTFFLYQVATYISKYQAVKKISFLGRYSGPFYLIHVYFIRLIYSFFDLPPFFQWYEHIFVVGGSLAFFALSLLVTIALVKIPYTDMLLFANFMRYKNLPFIKKTLRKN